MLFKISQMRLACLKIDALTSASLFCCFLENGKYIFFLISGIDARHLKNYKKGIITSSACHDTDILVYHQVLLVGYGEGNLKYLISHK